MHVLGVHGVLSNFHILHAMQKWSRLLGHPVRAYAFELNFFLYIFGSKTLKDICRYSNAYLLKVLSFVYSESQDENGQDFLNAQLSTLSRLACLYIDSVEKIQNVKINTKKNHIDTDADKWSIKQR